jgi:hypothetical protein
MDETNCLVPGSATDRVIILTSSQGTNCDAAKDVYVGYLSFLSALRLSLSLYQFLLWRKREGRVAERTGKKRSRFPIVPSLSLISSVSIMMFTILTSLNIANSNNGVPVILYTLYFIPVSLQGMIMHRRIVRLGAKIIPLSKANLSAIGNRAILSSLSDVPWWFVWIVRISHVVELLMFISGVFVAPLIAPSYVPVQIIEASLAYLGLAVIGLSVGHSQRVVSAINKCLAPGENIQLRKDSENAVRSLRMQQIGPAIMCVLGGSLHLLIAAAVVPMNYMYVDHFRRINR